MITMMAMKIGFLFKPFNTFHSSKIDLALNSLKI